MNTSIKHNLKWRLRMLMAEYGISKATELQRLLSSTGYSITSSQLSRIIKEKPERISIHLVEHLLDIFNCEIWDLLESGSHSGNDRMKMPIESKQIKPEISKPRVRRKVVESDEKNNVTGPKVTPFPLPNRK